jgi:DNA-directed RNA polymerase specialized sigma24 family protein
LETRPDIDFAELAVRLAGYGLRVFAEFGLGGRDATVPGVGLSLEDFVWNVLSQYAEGALVYDAARGELFPLLARALRNDVIDALRKAAHFREEARSPIPRESTADSAPPALDEMPSSGASLEEVLAEDRYRARLFEAFAEEPELAAVVRTVLDLNLTRPREIAAALAIPVSELQNRKKRLRRRLIEYHAVEVMKR